VASIAQERLPDLPGDTIVPLYVCLERPVKVELVTNLKRQATKILAELRLSKEPVLITEHGQPSAYLVDVQDYDFMQRRLELLEGLSRGERAVLEGRTYSQSEAREKMSKWLK
jgi:prevent-host-death family protein